MMMICKTFNCVDIAQIITGVAAFDFFIHVCYFRGCRFRKQMEKLYLCKHDI